MHKIIYRPKFCSFETYKDDRIMEKTERFGKIVLFFKLRGMKISAQAGLSIDFIASELQMILYDRHILGITRGWGISGVARRRPGGSWGARDPPFVSFW